VVIVKPCHPITVVLSVRLGSLRGIDTSSAK
jgi:hypothetical protein